MIARCHPKDFAEQLTHRTKGLPRTLKMAASEREAFGAQGAIPVGAETIPHFGTQGGTRLRGREHHDSEVPVHRLPRLHGHRTPSHPHRRSCLIEPGTGLLMKVAQNLASADVVFRPVQGPSWRWLVCRELVWARVLRGLGRVLGGRACAAHANRVGSARGVAQWQRVQGRPSWGDGTGQGQALAAACRVPPCIRPASAPLRSREGGTGSSSYLFAPLRVRRYARLAGPAARPIGTAHGFCCFSPLLDCPTAISRSRPCW